MMRERVVTSNRISNASDQFSMVETPSNAISNEYVSEYRDSSLDVNNNPIIFNYVDSG